jgi:hypothetical protein
MLHVGVWWWSLPPKPKYDLSYIAKLRSGIAKHLQQPYQFHVFEPPPEDVHWTARKGCFARIRSFDPEWQASQGIAPGDRLVIIDLDVIITGPLDALFDRPDDFTILEGANATNPCPTNGSVWMLRAGTHVDVFTSLTLEAVDAMPRFDFADDQEWLLLKIPDYAGWKVGKPSGIYAYHKPGWPTGIGDRLPDGARIVAFPGYRDPSMFTHMRWVKDNWRVHEEA